MNNKPLIAFALAVAALLSLAHYAPARAQKWELVWRDEFGGAKGAAADEKKWAHETGGAGWGNRELEYYTGGAANAQLDGKGSLVIKAAALTPPGGFECWYGPCRYTSARLVTKEKFAQVFGRFEARIRVPRGQGVWPAFWLLGADIDKVGWPRCGEIDVMENIGREPSFVHGTLHGPGYSGAGGIGAPYTLPAGKLFADDFHVFAVEWEPNAVRWYVDGALYETRTPADLPAGSKWVFDHPFFIILNLAVGGAWPGDPDPATAFPQTMLVDYVRVYRRSTPSSRARNSGAAARLSAFSSSPEADQNCAGDVLELRKLRGPSITQPHA